MRSIAAIKAFRILLSTRTGLVPFARASTTPFKAGDPAVHAQLPEGEDAEAADQNLYWNQKHHVLANNPTEPVKTPPFASSPKLESSGVGTHVEPVFQQKRQQSKVLSLDSVSCIGVDGTPLVNKGINSYENGGVNKGINSYENGGENDADDYRIYYEEHKPSPLSEIEFADSRLPITRATDGEKRDDIWGEGRGYIIEDTVEEALQRAEAMFNEARERGDPTMPHSRALMRKLHELYQMKVNGM